MSEDRRKTNKHSTGTVPKAKHRNNAPSRNLTNNLSSDYKNLIRNPRRNCSMDQQNGNFTSHSSSTSSTRRNSFKCDNVTKYPDKKQIEDKLSQIREYLRITTSLMNSMKSTDDQNEDQQIEQENLRKMIVDLSDSEVKLMELLKEEPEENEVEPIIIEPPPEPPSLQPTVQDEVKLEAASRDVEMLLEHQRTLQKLQQKAENKLKDVRQIQDKLLLAANYESPKNNDFDRTLHELEERAKSLDQRKAKTKSVVQDRMLAEVDNLHSEIVNLRTANDERVQLIEFLDTRDQELRSHQAELQSKLLELQSKKLHVDSLVSQLQEIEDGEAVEEAPSEAQNLITMKDQLKKLKDMLEIVKTTENLIINTNGEAGQDEACALGTTTENFLQKDQMARQYEGNVMRYENNTETRPNKQTNKSLRDQQVDLGRERALQAELEAKKRELEEFMGKHKAGTSNLNHDFNSDNKTEFGSAWPPLSPANRTDSSEQFSSDDQYNDYTELCSNQVQTQQQPLLMAGPSSGGGAKPKPRVDYASSTDVERAQRAPETNDSNTAQTQKQLKLIKSLCEAMLEQQNPVVSSSNVQVRNNLTPSPLYSEPRPLHTPVSSVNVVQPTDTPWHAPNLHFSHDLSNYQGWMANNTLQNSFVLSTLNQCCQMLCLQQRELAGLRHSVAILQNRLDESASFTGVAPSMFRPPNPTTNLLAPPTKPLPNQVSAACSLPNLNHFNVLPSLDASVLAPQPPLNNLNHLNQTQVGLNNQVLSHDVGVNINQNLGGVATSSSASSSLWHGQALNNQVAPGNRANNYWDNFRSYSRQNLLSTKNADVLGAAEPQTRPTPFALMMSKSNSESTVTSQENTPRRQRPVSSSRRVESCTALPPDVLNIHNHVEAEPVGGDLFTHSNLDRNNDWPESKSKLFDELRENVYKEVASLISANEARPHFLIQLFRDLQMIGSDSLRLKILQSIQSVITHSIVANRRRDSQPSDSSDTGGASSVPQPPPPPLWLKPKNTRSVFEDQQLQSPLRELHPFLQSHDNDFIQLPFLLNLKQLLFDSEAVREIVADSVFHKHFSNVLDEVLAQYLGKRVRDVKVHLLQALSDLLQGEISFIQLIQETAPPSGDGEFDLIKVDNHGLLENGDLAEADQTRSGAEEELEDEEEGAVGGVLNAEKQDEGEEPMLDFSRNVEGLDQVPTRLPTHRSRSITPNTAEGAMATSSEPF